MHLFMVIEGQWRSKDTKEAFSASIMWQCIVSRAVLSWIGNFWQQKVHLVEFY